jgi:hypothetical protein
MVIVACRAVRQPAHYLGVASLELFRLPARCFRVGRCGPSVLHRPGGPTYNLSPGGIARAAERTTRLMPECRQDTSSGQHHEACCDDGEENRVGQLHVFKPQPGTGGCKRRARRLQRPSSSPRIALGCRRLSPE